MTRLTINGTSLQTDAAPDTPLLWVLRDRLNLTGTKYGCGMSLCVACTVHVDGVATVPTGHSWHWPEPLHSPTVPHVDALVAAHSLSVSVPAMAGVHCP